MGTLARASLSIAVLMISSACHAQSTWWKTHRLEKPSEYYVRGDRCRYFVISQMPLEAQIRRIYSRQDCPTAGVNHTFVDVDCSTLKYRLFGDSFTSPEAIKQIPNQQWLDANRGTSKAPLIDFICFSWR